MTEAVDLEKCAADLAKSELFQGLDQEQLEMIAQLCELLILERGEFFSREGETADWFYILLEGRVSLSMKFELPRLEHRDTEERTLTTVDAANHPVLGETALVGQTARSTTMRCARDCKLYRIQAHDMLALMQIDPLIGFFVFKHLAERLYTRLRSANSDTVKLSAALVYALEERTGDH
jgi:CRP/FNR family cyclic AMP-dependent transcriptional regulator